MGEFKNAMVSYACAARRDELGRRVSRAWIAVVLAGLLIGAFCLAQTAHADEPSEETDIPSVVNLLDQPEGRSSVLYCNTNGLPTSEANAVAETSEGFIWIGSYSGLIRYDGTNFVRIDSTTGVASVVSLYVDSRDRLWVGTNDGGVAVMEKGEFTFFTKADGLGSSSVRAMAECPDGTVFVATTKGVSMFDADMNLKAVEDERIDEAYVRDLRTGVDGNIYGVTSTGGVFALDAAGTVLTFLTSEQLGVNCAISLLPDPDRAGWVYLGTEGSDVHYGKLGDTFGEKTSLSAAPLEYVNSIESFDGQIVLCSDNGIGLVKGDRVNVVENIPLDNSIEHAMTDYEGNLWFTSSRQGVMKVVPNQFTDIFERYGLPDAVVNTTCTLGDYLFVGTDTGLTIIGPNGLEKSMPLKSAVTASGKKLEETDLISLLEGQRVRCITHDSKGRIWFATFGDTGLVRYDDSVATCFTSEDGLPFDRVRGIVERSDGAIMAACVGGLAIIEDNTVTEVYDESDGVVNSDILTVCEAGNGDMVLGTDGDGIYVLHEGEITRIGVEQGLGSDVVMRVKRDEARNLFWIVTSNSLAYMKENYKVTTVKNFPYSNNFDLVENSEGEIWVLSSNGIYVTTAEALTANRGIDPVYYSRDNGLPVIATANSYSDVSGDGDLYIAGTTGVAKVNIEIPFENVSKLKMAVPFVEADGKMIYPDDEGNITLPAGTSKLTVYPFVFTYSLMNPQVYYRLDGFENADTETKASGLGPVDYTNLGAGDYQFTMRLTDSMGHGSAELVVNISRPAMIYETLWFWLALGMLVVAVAAVVVALTVRAYYRRKTARLAAKEQEERQFISEITKAFARTIDMKDHYTNGHSSRVAAYTEKLARELGYDDETVERYFNIALLHDIGKIGVPSVVLNKPGRLTDEEFATIKSHAELGYRVLKDISIMPELATGAQSHHERPDGKGYPQGLVGDEIPRVAQIIAVADTFDAMYSDRPYRNRMNFDKVVSVIREVRGTQLAADVVDAFLRLVEQGEFRASDDTGGGSMEEIDNLRKK